MKATQGGAKIKTEIWHLKHSLVRDTWLQDNAILQKQQNINRYVRAYYSDNAEVTMELEGIEAFVLYW